MKSVLAIVLYLVLSKLNAQVISGLVKEVNGPVPGALIQLLDASDSSLTANQVTSIEGKFFISGNGERSLLKISFLGMETSWVGPFETNSLLDIGTIQLKPEVHELESVVISAQKSWTTQGLDRRVYTVGENLTVFGGSAADVLANVPSVIVEPQGGIVLRGSSQVTVLIDGKQSGITGINRSNFLQSISANSIERIEIYTNPSAKFDAAGAAGIINIVLKKNREEGLHTKMSLGIGNYERGNSSINANLMTKNVNVFANYAYDRDTWQYDGDRERIDLASNDRFVQKVRFERPAQDHTLKTGIDLFFGEDVLTGYLLYNYSISDEDTYNLNQIINLDNELIEDTRRDVEEPETNSAFDYSLSYSRQFDQKDHVLEIASIFTSSTEEEPVFIKEQPFDLISGEPFGPVYEINTALNDVERRLLLQMDYQKPFESGSLETGYKSIFRTITSDFRAFESDEDQLMQPIEGLANDFRYRERIYAAYALWNRNGALFWSLGLRAEQTLTTPEYLLTDERFKNDYFNLFPTVSLGHKMGLNSRMKVSYSRRINRPDFWHLNPFPDLFNPFTRFLGNPTLDPELIDSYELGWELDRPKFSLTTSGFYRETHDMIQRILTLEDELIISTPMNISRARDFGIELIGDFDLTAWIDLDASASVFQSAVEAGELGTDNDLVTWSFRFLINAQPWPGADVQINTIYNGRALLPQGEVAPITYTDVSFKQSLWRQHGFFTVQLSDVLDNRRWKRSSADDFFEYTSYTDPFSRLLLVGVGYEL